MKSIIKSAKTVDEAIELGLKEIGLSREEAEIEVMQESTKGIFGIFGGNDAIVKIKEKTKMKIDIDDIFADSRLNFEDNSKENNIYEVEEEVNDDFDDDFDEDDFDEDSFEEETDVVKKTTEEKEVTDEVDASEEEIEEVQEVELAESETEKEHEEFDNNEENEVYSTNSEDLVNTRELDFSGNADIVADNDDIEETAKKIKSNLEDILVKMHIDSKVTYETEKDNIINLNLTDISENDTGIVIGSKGETLNAIQYILSLLTNKHTNKYYRVTLNVANYRDRRKKSIEINAQKVAYKVLKTKKSIALRPMNSYERRIVHYALQNYKGIETVSTGKFPNRKVVVKYQEQ